MKTDLSASKKRHYSSLTLKDAMRLIPVEVFTPWELSSAAIPPTSTLTEVLRRLESFDTETTEQAKTLLMDALFAEVVSNYEHLKVWKAILIESDDLTGIADYLITPRRAYVATPLLCVTEAKRDDFVQGRARCVAEMITCQRNNADDGFRGDVFGIVSNGQTWQFYKLMQEGTIYETLPYSTSELPKLLGALNYICAECAALTG